MVFQARLSESRLAIDNAPIEKSSQERSACQMKLFSSSMESGTPSVLAYSIMELKRFVRHAAITCPKLPCIHRRKTESWSRLAR